MFWGGTVPADKIGPMAGVLRVKVVGRATGVAGGVASDDRPLGILEVEAERRGALLMAFSNALPLF